ncbi:EAL domain-containing protein [filamentous cyanobacterium LEGE 11480]|uniref:EAL domain-containing protein n=1 Tax=Romeriopsis navalis LEGE 11480 TaxID=2777977 RepID=A0A928VLW3_9CYAN|nr:EAL domain-containing protein [Romeriopsis navalis]MBE9028409.1 EAL domain-containing protein [Romeriopsis navalis LEGE 11480]
MSKVHLTQMSTIAPTSINPQAAQAVDACRHSDVTHATLEAISHAVITTNLEGQIQYCNPPAIDLLTSNVFCQTESNLVGQKLDHVLPLVDEQTRQPLNSLIQQLQQVEPNAFEIVNQAAFVTDRGQEIALDLTVAPIYETTAVITGTVFMLRDVTQARQANHALLWQAHHDALTGLVNRGEFEAQLTQAIAEAKQSDHTHTLCYIDLDQFKIVNDTCGHNAGDELLRRLAQIFQREIRQSDTLSRVGGDEFSILFHQCSLDQARQIVERIHQQVEQFRFLWEEQSFNISASFGLVQIDTQSEGLTTVLSAADAACYAAKEAGRNRIHLYYSDDDELTRQRSERMWISQIHQAIEEQRFQLYAQDIVPISRNSDVIESIEHDHLPFERHVEILLRMIDRDGKIVPPGCFIPAAERYGLMTDLDRVVIDTFFKSYAQACLSNSGRPLDSCLYAINLSARSLNDAQFIDFVKEQFQKYRLPPHVICFEITETAAISNVDQASQFIQELKQMGCHFALDDFGSGMNCFAYLKQLKIDYLKIDGSFIKNITTEKIDQELVSCMNRIAHVLGVKTVAEWVENDEILHTLRGLDIDYAQGYGLHRPEPLEFTLKY